MPIRWHADDPDLLVQAVEFTARQTGFNPRLVEKDYFCSVVLEHLAAREATLCFKGGVSPGRLGQLPGQLEPELRPVLRAQEFAQFDLARALETVRTIARQLE